MLSRTEKQPWELSPEEIKEAVEQSLYLDDGGQYVATEAQKKLVKYWLDECIEHEHEIFVPRYVCQSCRNTMKEWAEGE